MLPADVPDRDGAKTLLGRVRGLRPRLRVPGADGASAAVVDGVRATLGWLLTTLLRPVGALGYVPLPRRWIVERTFGWLGRSRRLSKDYEPHPRRSEARIDRALIHRRARALLPNRKDKGR